MMAERVAPIKQPRSRPATPSRPLSVPTPIYEFDNRHARKCRGPLLKRPPANCTTTLK